MQQDATPTGASEYVLEAHLAHIRGMLGVLQTIKQTKKQVRSLRGLNRANIPPVQHCTSPRRAPASSA